MPDSLDPKEAKTLSDILALVLDDHAGPATAALQKLRQRAQADRVTAGALKNLFARLAGPTAGDGGSLRELVAEQAATIRALQQQVRAARGQLAEALGAQDARADAAAKRRVVLVVGLGCAGTAVAVLAGVIGWRLGRHAAPRPAQPPASVVPGSIAVVPPVRDPSDTAPPPAYPPEARRRGEEGTVALLVHIDAEGHVSGIGVSQSAGADLDVAAQQAVREWRFRPELRDGKPVASQLMLRFTFVLKKDQ